MSKKINCTLTDAQWQHLIEAMALYMVDADSCVLADVDVTQRDIDTAERMWGKILPPRMREKGTFHPKKTN